MSRGKVSANREMEAGEELAGTLGGSPVRALRWVFLIAAVIALLALGSRLLQDRKYNLISVLIVLAACFAFYFTYEKREGSIRRMVLLAVMTAISVTGRFIFGPVPFFKPVTAVVVLTGIFIGPESGFLVGSLSAVISNIFLDRVPGPPFRCWRGGRSGCSRAFRALEGFCGKRRSWPPTGCWQASVTPGLWTSGRFSAWTGNGIGSDI